MATEDVEAIRQRMVSLLVDSEELKRKVNRVVRSKNKSPQEALSFLKQIADRIDRETRELYYLLPEHLRPDEMPRPQNPRALHPEGAEEREYSRPKPGKPLPREVRWPSWTIEQILVLADAFKEKHDKWPNKSSGRINEAAPDTWNGIDIALQRGNRDLPGGTSLARLLSEYREVRTRVTVPPLNLEKILEWAEDHYARTQTWPTSYSGPVDAAPGETWREIDKSLRRGYRSIGTKTSLSLLLFERRTVPHILHMTPLTEELILLWADAYKAQSGKWPTRDSGAISGTESEYWSRIDSSLIQGNRSLPGGSSLARLLAQHRDVRNRKALPRFEVEKLLLWADRHYERHGRWPTCWSGPIDDVPNETWNAVDSAFKAGGRGLAEAGYRSLAHLLDECRGKLKHRGNLPAIRQLPNAPENI